MKYLIISDTHDHIKNLNELLRRVDFSDIQKVIHLGDFCSPFMVPPFKGLPFHALFGNNDGDHFNILKKITEIGGTHHGNVALFDDAGKKMIAYHGTDEAITSALIGCQNYDYVLTGHLHLVIDNKVGITRHLNPGSLHGFDKRPSCMILDVVKDDVEVIYLDDIK